MLESSLKVYSNISKISISQEADWEVVVCLWKPFSDLTNIVGSISSWCLRSSIWRSWECWELLHLLTATSVPCPWSHIYKSHKLHAFFIFLKYPGLILVKVPLGCRNSKPKCAAAAASEGIVWNLISCGCVGYRESLHGGVGWVLLPAPGLSQPLTLPAVQWVPLAHCRLFDQRVVWQRRAALSNLDYFVPSFPQPLLVQSGWALWQL